MERAGDFGPIAQIRVMTGATPQERRRNVAHALTLGLPELQAAPIRRVDRLTILASGPTFDESPRGLSPTLAVNGALDLMRERCEWPDWWAACDPQAKVAQFLVEPPYSTIYLLASTCHPDVFDALSNRDVYLWHLDDSDGTQGYGDLLDGKNAIARLSSITCEALELARVLGFNRQQTWGWDGCVRGFRDHANWQSDGREIVTFDVGGRLFPTSRAAIYELLGAAGLLKIAPRDLIVNGGGMFATALGLGGLINQTELAA